MVNRVTYTGDLGYEIWVEPDYQRRLYQAIMAAGAEFGIVDFGMRALLSHAAGEELPDLVSRAPARSTGRSRPASDRFVDLDKNDFIGREAAAQREGGRAASCGASPSSSMPTTPT